MRGTELAEAMSAVVDQLVSAREGTGPSKQSTGPSKQSIIGTIGWFGGKNATSYLEAFRTEMIMRDILHDRRLSRFPQVLTLSIHAEVLEV